MTDYIELACTTAYSFLHGACSPADMVRRAVALGHGGIGITDRNTVSGVVRAKIEIDRMRAEGEPIPDDFQLVTGARLVFADGTGDIIAYPETRHGWGRLTRLLSTGNLRAKREDLRGRKGVCELHFDDLLAHLDDLLLIALPGATPDMLRRLAAAAPGRVWLGAVMNRSGRDARELARAHQLAMAANVPLIALNDALHAAPGDRPLQDVMTAIRLHTTVQAAGSRAPCPCRAAPQGRRTKCCASSRPARTPLCRPGASSRASASASSSCAMNIPMSPCLMAGKRRTGSRNWSWKRPFDRYGNVIPGKVQKLIRKELDLIREERYAHYFLTVHDIVRYARTREPPILCQGRGSAANSIVCFLLGVTSIDPMQHDLLFSRFLSAERKEPPDIDIDFEHERREEVIQYMYKRYGRERAGIAATVIHYRARSAVREVGKALGLSEDVTTRMRDTVWGSYASSYERKRVEESGFDPDNPQIARLNDFVQRILNLPRHLSQHVGGFVLTQGRLDELVPVHHAAMDERTFIEWDKEDIDALRIMKVDVLALGMLTCIAKCFEMMRLHGLGEHDLKTDIESSDPAVYDMLCEGDSIGVFQVESRAQINMLPRLRPRIFYDLVVQVAIVRPGPIEGDMVHPYLRRRCGEEAIDFPSPALHYPQDELHDVLGKTCGVPLFQEQAMQLAITAAEFTDEEANQLRRAMATFRNVGTIHKFREKMVGGMVRRGYEADFAERCFKQIEGFGSYGFPESHAQEFRAAGLCLGLAQMPLSGGVRLWPAERAAHGLLRAGPAGARCGRAWRADPADRREYERLGQWAGGYFARNSVRPSLSKGRPSSFPPSLKEGQPFDKIEVNGSGKDLISHLLPTSPCASASARSGASRRTGPSPSCRARARAGPFASIEDLARPRRVAVARAPAARRCRCLPQPRAGSARGALGGPPHPDRRAAALRRRPRPRAGRGARHRAQGDVAGRACRRRLSDSPPLTEGASDAAPAALVRRRACHPQHRLADRQERRPCPRRRRGAGPPAAGQGQCHLHHAGGRGRDLQHPALGAPPSSAIAAP